MTLLEQAKLNVQSWKQSNPTSERRKRQIRYDKEVQNLENEIKNLSTRGCCCVIGAYSLPAEVWLCKRVKKCFEKAGFNVQYSQFVYDGRKTANLHIRWN